MSKMLIAFLVLVLAMLACGQPAEEWQLRGWTVTPSPFPTSANTPTATVPTQTPFVLVVTETPRPTQEASAKCVSATVAVHLRPSPSTENYPITAIPNGSRLEDLGGRSGAWLFVRHDALEGWIYGDYVQECG